MREDAEKLTKNIHEQLEHTCLRDITVVIHIIAATKSMGAKELLIEMVWLALNTAQCWRLLKLYFFCQGPVFLIRFLVINMFPFFVRHQD